MNEKITNLIKELSLECAKEEITLSLCAFDKDGEAAVAQVGSKSSIEKSINAQVANWFELLEECEACQAKLAEYASNDDDEEEEMIADVFSTLADKLEEFLKENTTRGDF